MSLLLKQVWIFPAALTSDMPFYEARSDDLFVAHFHDDGTRTDMKAVNLPEGTVRFHMMRQCITPLKKQ